MNIENRFDLISSARTYEAKIVELISQTTMDLFVQMIRSNEYKVLSTEIVQASSPIFDEVAPCQLLKVHFDAGSEILTMMGRITMKMTLDGSFKIKGEIL